MSSEWLTYRLDEVGRIVTGKTPKSGVAEFEGEEVPFISPPDFSGNKWVTESARAISVAGAQSVKSSIIPPQSVLVTCIGSDMGKAAIAASTCVTNQQINAVVADGSRFSPEFLYYNLSLRKSEIRGLAGGSAQPILNKSAFGRISFEAPSLKEQLRIVDVLSPLDDRITLLRETNATLEAIAQALFKSWFVDFDPVHAKQQGRAPEDMDEATATLFPDSFEESELGLVPKGWQVGSLADLAALNSESWTAKKHPDTVAYIDLANAKDNEIAEVTIYAFDEAPSRARRVLRGGDTIVGTVRPGNRSFAFIHQAASNLTASTGFAVLRPREIENTEFVYLTATQDSSIEHLAHVADGGAYPAVRPEVVAGIECVLPSSTIMQAFHDVTAPLLAGVAENQHQAQTLATLRDTLLPRLISGQLRLPDFRAG